MGIDENALAVLDRAGIQRQGGFSEWLTQMAEKARVQMEQTPVIGEIGNGDDYKYCKATLAAYRKVKKEAEEGRKSITSQLDAAKKAVMSFTSDSIVPIEDGIATLSKLQREYEERGRAEKRNRLESWWERGYPLLACAQSEAQGPLVPFTRIFDPDWVKRVGELDKDDKAHEAMSALADGIVAAQGEIEAAGLDPDVRSLALSRLFGTLDTHGNIAWANDQARRQRELTRVQEAVVPREAPVEPEPTVVREAPVEPGPDQVPQTAPEPAAAGRAQVTLDLPCEPQTGRVLCVWVHDSEELKRAREAMVSAGLHGCIGKVM